MLLKNVNLLTFFFVVSSVFIKFTNTNITTK